MQPGVTVLHMITGLNVGGAEAMLAKLVSHPAITGRNQRHEVLSLMRPGVVGERLRDAGLPVRSLNMTRGMPSLGAAVGLARVMRQLRPQIVQGWMHHGNLAATIGGRLVSPRPQLMWNVRHSLDDIAVEKPMTRRILKLEAWMSRQPARVIYNSQAAASQHAGIGFDQSRETIIPNGFDCLRFAPDSRKRQTFRRLFEIRNQATVVAMVARSHPMKSVETLVEAVRLARLQGADLHLLLAGQDMDRPSPALRETLAAAVPPERLTLAGHRADLADWLAGVDMVALSSAWGEAFPNILGEAMACGVPCVTTDVGDSGWLVGQAGLVVPPRDPQAMAQALCRLERLGIAGRRVLGAAGRKRVIEHFSLDETVQRYEALYSEIAGAGAVPA